MERLQKVIANSGYCSRRKAEDEILKGNVSVNGEIIKEMGYKVNPNDVIIVNGVKLDKSEKVYVLLNKPRGVITSVSDDKERKTVVDLVQIDTRIYPVGRLDYDTTGALLLTNDGELTNLLTHPKNHIPKVYMAKVEGIITGKEIHELEKGVVIDGKRTMPAKVKLRKLDKDKKVSMVELTIFEGRNHQVKKMFLKIGFPVIKLKREKIAFLNVKNLNSGEYRYLNPKEVKQLYSLTK